MAAMILFILIVLFSLKKDSLIVENEKIKRAYQFNNGNLITQYIANKETGFQWKSAQNTPDMALPGTAANARFVSFRTYLVKETWDA